MHRRIAGLFTLALLVLLAAWSPSARADIPPSPQRPADWDEHPAPLPAPPPEKDLAARVVLLAAVLSLAGGAAVLTRRWRARSLVRAEHRG